MWGQRLNQLTETQRKDIWLRVDEGNSMTQLAKRYGVSVATISRIASDRRQRTNVIAVIDEIPEVVEVQKGRQEQREEGQGRDREHSAASLAEGRKRKPGRPATETAGN